MPNLEPRAGAASRYRSQDRNITGFQHQSARFPTTHGQPPLPEGASNTSVAVAREFLAQFRARATSPIFRDLAFVTTIGVIFGRRSILRLGQGPSFAFWFLLPTDRMRTAPLNSTSPDRSSPCFLSLAKEPAPWRFIGSAPLPASLAIADLHLDGDGTLVAVPMACFRFFEEDDGQEE